MSRGNSLTDRKGDKNPNYKHGLKNTRLFRIWVNMKTRCYNSNAKGYKNCRWATNKIQSTNRRNNHLYTINGETKALSLWCEQFNINYKTVRDRLKRKWKIETALSYPVNIKFRRKVK